MTLVKKKSVGKGKEREGKGKGKKGGKEKGKKGGKEVGNKSEWESKSAEQQYLTSSHFLLLLPLTYSFLNFSHLLPLITIM